MFKLFSMVLLTFITLGSVFSASSWALSNFKRATDYLAPEATYRGWAKPTGRSLPEPCQVIISRERHGWLVTVSTDHESVDQFLVPLAVQSEQGRKDYKNRLRISKAGLFMDFTENFKNDGYSQSTEVDHSAFELNATKSSQSGALDSVGISYSNFTSTGTPTPFDPGDRIQCEQLEAR